MFQNVCVWIIIAGKVSRRRATVTICVPLVSSASLMALLDENLPVPRKSRDSKVRFAILSGAVSSDIKKKIVEPKADVEMAY